MLLSRRTATFWFAFGICCTWLTGCATTDGEQQTSRPVPVPAESAPPPVSPPASPAVTPSSSPPASSAAPDTQASAAAAAAVDPVVPVIVVPDNAPVPQVQSPLSPQTSDLWHRIRLGFKMPDLDTRLADDRTRWYAGQPDYFARMTQRSSRYLFHIVEGHLNRECESCLR